MKTIYYHAIIEKGDIEYGVFFPDLDGCTSGGETQEEAILNAREALALHIKGLWEDGEELPEPSPLENISLENNEIKVLINL